MQRRLTSIWSGRAIKFGTRNTEYDNSIKSECDNITFCLLVIKLFMFWRLPNLLLSRRVGGSELTAPHLYQTHQIHRLCDRGPAYKPEPPPVGISMIRTSFLTSSWGQQPRMSLSSRYPGENLSTQWETNRMIESTPDFLNSMSGNRVINHADDNIYAVSPALQPL